MKSGKKVIIVGGVAGGASCAARLRRLDEAAEIILLERGEYVSYANCGLPYHVGDVIPNRDALLVQTPATLNSRLAIDVRVQNEATAIDRAGQTVTILDRTTGQTYTEAYDALVLATGSSPLRPPIPGIDSPRIQTLWTLPDTDRIRAMSREAGVKTAAVVGGGFIGLEMAENLHHLGLSVSLIEAADQVMAPLDAEMAQLLHKNLRQNGVALHLGDGVQSFTDTGSGVDIRLSSGGVVSVDLVILAIGVRPNSALAREAGLTLNPKGGVVVTDDMLTSDPHIYAVGDVVEIQDFVTGSRTMVPLAGPANKQGRIAADNIAGIPARYKGTQGTFVAKVCDLTAAATGQNEKNLRRDGKAKDADYGVVYITQQSHAGYYPGAVPLTLKAIYALPDGKLLGAQAVGLDGVDKRMDVLAAALRLGASVYDLKDLELGYAPPYSSAKDPVNMLGFAAENVRDGRMTFADWAIKPDRETVFLDVREDMEVQAMPIPNATHVSLSVLRDHLHELDPGKRYVTFCAIGLRGYIAARVLTQRGFDRVEVYPGGAGFYLSIHETDGEPYIRPAAQPPIRADVTVDCGGLQCPGPITQVVNAAEALTTDQVLEVRLSDPGFLRDIYAWCRHAGVTFLTAEARDDGYAAYLKR